MIKKNSKYLVLILARKNSKRLKNKNILKLNNKPLISWTLNKLLKIKPLFSDIIVSSDSEIIQKIVEKNNFIFIKRPKKYSTDKVSSEASAIHATNYYVKKYKKKIDYVILLQPTSPFRKNSTIKKAIYYSKIYPKKQIVSTNIKNELNGVLYLTPLKTLENKKNFSYKNFKPLIIKSKKESLDIDSRKDFLEAKNYLKNKL